jgi:hypothetical protein
MRRLRIKDPKKTKPDLSVPPIARLFDDAHEAELNAVLAKKPSKPRLKSKDTNEQVFELELALKVRDRYIKALHERYEKSEEKNKIYEKFLMDMEVNFMLLKDYKAVQELIDRACQWSSAHRNAHGELGPIDRAAALELATKRLTP